MLHPGSLLPHHQDSPLCLYLMSSQWCCRGDSRPVPINWEGCFCVVHLLTNFFINLASMGRFHHLRVLIDTKICTLQPFLHNSTSSYNEFRSLMENSTGHFNTTLYATYSSSKSWILQRDSILQLSTYFLPYCHSSASSYLAVLSSTGYFWLNIAHSKSIFCVALMTCQN